MLHLGFVDQVRGLLVHVKALGGDRAGRGTEHLLGQRFPVEDVVHAPQAAFHPGHALVLHARGEGEQFLQIIEARFLRFREVRRAGQRVDFTLDLLLPPGEGIELGLRVDQRLVGPAHRHELANQRHLQVAARFAGLRILAEPAVDRVDEVEVLVHFFVFDQGPAENDLGNENHRNDVDRRFAFAGQTRNKQPDGDAADRGEHHGREENPEHAAHLENPVADENEEHALHHGEE